MPLKFINPFAAYNISILWLWNKGPGSVPFKGSVLICHGLFSLGLGECLFIEEGLNGWRKRMLGHSEVEVLFWLINAIFGSSLHWVVGSRSRN